MKVHLPGGTVGQRVFALGPILFLTAAVAAYYLRGPTVEPLVRMTGAVGIALLGATLLGSAFARVRAPRELGWLAAGAWLATTAAPALVATTWSGLSIVGLAFVGLAFGQRLVGTSPVMLQLGVVAGSVASVTGFGASLLATLILGAVLGQGPADEGELGLRFYQAVDSGLASALINPWFVALVLATRAFDRRVEQFAVIAALSSVVATTAGSVLLRHPVPIDLWWTAGLMVGAALSAAYVARRGPELKSTAVAVGVVAIALASAQGNPVSVLLVTVTAGWVHAALDPRGRVPTASSRVEPLAAVVFVYLVLFASERGMPDGLATAMAGATLAVVRIGVVVFVVQRLTLLWNLPFTEVRALPMLVVVGGGWEALGGMALHRAPGLLLIEEVVALAVGLVWLGRRGREPDAAPAPEEHASRSPVRARRAVRRRSFSDRWLDSEVERATGELIRLQERLEDAILARRVASVERLAALREHTAALVPGDRATAERFHRASRGWGTQAKLPEDVTDAFLRDAMRIVEPRLVLQVPLEDAFLISSPGDGPLLRFVKVVRRARVRTVGAPKRTVRVGRAWRDHVGSSLPIEVERALRAYFDALAALEASLVDLTIQIVRGRTGIAPPDATTPDPAALDAIAAGVDEATQQVLGRLARSTSRLHRSFVRQVAREGTVQGVTLWRPRLGDARRAWRVLRRQAATFHESGLVRWRRVELEGNLARVASWLTEFEAAVAADLERAAPRATPQDATRLRAAIAERITDCARHVPGTDAIRRFERRIATLPSEIVVAPRSSTQPSAGAYDVVRLDLRRFVQSETAREGALAVVEATRALERALRRGRAALTDGVDPDPVVQDLDAEIGRVVATLTERFTALRADLGTVTSRLVLLRGRASDLQRSTLARRAVIAGRWFMREVVPWLGALTRDLRDELRERPKAEQRDDLRRFDARLRGAEAVPEHYRRLFDPGLLDVAGFFVTRPALEERLIVAMERTGPRPPASVLIVGPRGSGKTALLQHVLPRANADALHEIPIQRGAPVPMAIADALGLDAPDAPDALAKLSRWADAQTSRPVLVLDDLELAVERTPEGLEAVAALRDLIASTSAQVTWIAVLRTPTARFLDLALGLFDAFDHLVEIPPLTPAETERMVMQRHQASGYELTMGAAPLNTWRGLVERLPPQRWRARRRLFERLQRYASGNPELAQRLWLASLRVGDAPPTVHVTLQTPPALDLAAVLTDDQRAVAACVVLHRALSAEEVALILRRALPPTRRDLDLLDRISLAATSGPGGRYELNALYALRAIQQLEQEHRL